MLLEAALPVAMPIRHWHLPCLSSLLSYLGCILLLCSLLLLLQILQLLLQALPSRSCLLLIIILTIILLVCCCVSSLKRSICPAGSLLLRVRSIWGWPWTPGDTRIRAFAPAA
jgi:hypothetical protein